VLLAVVLKCARSWFEKMLVLRICWFENIQGWVLEQAGFWELISSSSNGGRVVSGSSS